MATSLIAAFVWMIVANVAALIPSKDHHWTRAYILMAVGAPLLIWIAYEVNIWAALLVLIAGMSILRWPVIYLTRWVRRVASRS